VAVGICKNRIDNWKQKSGPTNQLKTPYWAYCQLHLVVEFHMTLNGGGVLLLFSVSLGRFPIRRRGIQIVRFY